MILFNYLEKRPEIESILCIVFVICLKRWGKIDEIIMKNKKKTKLIHFSLEAKN